jgi:hypothetical protein
MRAGFAPLKNKKKRSGSCSGYKQATPNGVCDSDTPSKDQAMIQAEAQVRQAIQQMENLCRAINSLRAEVFSKNPRNFAILAEGPLEQIPPAAGAGGRIRAALGANPCLSQVRENVMTSGVF